MQHTDEKTEYLRKVIGKVFNEVRCKSNLSCNKIENEYEIGRGIINRIENAKIDTKIITAWRLSEALGVKLSDIIKTVEDMVGNNFKITDL